MKAIDRYYIHAIGWKCFLFNNASNVKTTTK